MRTVILSGPRGIRLVVEVPVRRRDRARGLIGRTGLPPGQGLLLLRASSVHTFGIRFPIVVASLDRGLRVVRVDVLPPRRLSWPRRGVRHVLECAPDLDLRPGDALRVVGLR